MKDIFLGIFFLLSMLAGFVGILMVVGFFIEFILFALYGLFTLELTILACLKYALWHTAVLVATGLLLVGFAWATEQVIDA